MSTEGALAEVETLLLRNQAAEAEDKMKALIYSMGTDELRVWEFDLRNVASKFFPKRRKAVILSLEERLGSGPAQPQQPAENSPSVEDLDATLRQALTDLSERHIFQWATFYREALSDAFRAFTGALEKGSPSTAVARVVRASAGWHSREIFQKGYDFVGAGGRLRYDQAMAKSLSGLQRFLEIPIELYTAQASAATSPAEARALRTVASAMTSGILVGYSNVRLGEFVGSQVLPRYPRSWAHYVAFLDGDSLRAVTEALEAGEFSAGISANVQPFVDALDALCKSATDYVPLPILGQLVWPNRRFEVSLKPPPKSQSGRPIEIHAYLDPGFVTGGAIAEAVSRDVCLVMAQVRPDLLRMVQATDRAADILVSPGDDPAATTRRVLEVIQWAIYRRRSVLAGTVPLSYNFAREFPLQNPNLARYFHVYRSSVRELLKTFERRNGVRLWCSVRRSGKTTACFDLGATTGGSTVISQTCGTARLPDASEFYDHVVEALVSSAQIDKAFLQRVVTDLAGKDPSGDRIVFVLDEYETLFGRLQSAVRKDPSVRYSVVQPLLNQMVEFASNNLLVLLGQQPTAHFILMDQNQLSPYVEQDPFPLFQHSPGGPPSEFRELIRRVLTERVEFESGFVDALFAETAGHPFLTVKLLIGVVDWLIEQKRSVGGLCLARGDFAQFAAARLLPAEVGRSPEYSFFREAIGEATSSIARDAQPWLYSVYSTMREVCRQSPTTLGCPVADYRALVHGLALDQIGVAPDVLLGTGIQANFFCIDQGVVYPKVRLLGRIASVSAPRVFS